MASGTLRTNEHSIGYVDSDLTYNASNLIPLGLTSAVKVISVVGAVGEANRSYIPLLWNNGNWYAVGIDTSTGIAKYNPGSGTAVKLRIWYQI